MTKRRQQQLNNLSLITLREYLARAIILEHSGQPCMQQYVDTLRGIITGRA